MASVLDYIRHVELESFAYKRVSSRPGAQIQLQNSDDPQYFRQKDVFDYRPRNYGLHVQLKCTKLQQRRPQVQPSSGRQKHILRFWP